MDVTDALAKRFSCRAFLPEPVKKEAVVAVLAAAIRAPSWGNTQPWELFVAGGEALERIRQGYLNAARKGVLHHPDLAAPRRDQWPTAMQRRTDELTAGRFPAGVRPGDPTALEVIRVINEQNYRFFGAPVVVYLCMDRGLTPWSIFDLGSLSDAIMLAATEKGLGSAPAFMLVVYPDLIRKELSIPPNLSIVFGIALGYPDMQNPLNKYRSTRRPVNEVVHMKGIGDT